MKSTSDPVQRDLATVDQEPTEYAQQRYPLSKYPCGKCAGSWGLPRLVDNSSEFYWHHVHPVGKGRAGCPRFGRSDFCGTDPRPGTAKVTRYRGRYREHLVKLESL